MPLSVTQTDRCRSSIRLDRLGGVFEHVCHRLAELVPVAGDVGHVLRGRERIVDLGMRHFLEEHGLADQIDRILVAEHRLRQPRER